MDKEMKREMRKIIDTNRSLGGETWKDYPEDKIKEIYGYLPSWFIKSINTK